MKQCRICKEHKPEDNFPVCGKTKTGKTKRLTFCRKCKVDRLKERGLCKCGKPLETGVYCTECRQAQREANYRSRQKNKLAAIERYGKCCVYCGTDEPVFLAIDHIDDNGAKHRKEEGIRTGTDTYRWLKLNNYPEGFQVTCHNCNAAKAQIGVDGLQKILRARQAKPDPFVPVPDHKPSGPRSKPDSE